MIAGVRQFKLINGNGTEYDMTRPDALLHAPDGLGWGTEATVNRLGMTYIGINEKEIHQSPSGEMVFRTYEEYGRFLSFCQQGGLVLCYKPIDTWYYCECLISIQKSEIQWENNHLICPVQFTLLSYWYEKVVAQTAEPPEPVEPNYSTVTGDPAVFTARYSYPIKDLSVAIQGSQDLNGYDKPWVGGAGSNKLPDNIKLIAGTYHGITVETVDGYTYRVTGTSTESTNINGTAVPTQERPIIPAGTYTFTGAGCTAQLYKADGVTFYMNVANGMTVTASEPFTIRNVFLFIAEGRTVDFNGFLGLALGSTRLSEWSPYENICPITSYTSVTITQTGSQTNTYTVELTGAGQVYKGTLDVTTGELVVEWAIVTADGTTRKLSAGYGGSGANWLPVLNVSSIGAGGDPSVEVPISNMLTYSSSIMSNKASMYWANSARTSIAIHIGDFQGTDGTHGYNSYQEVLTAVNAYLEDNPLTIVYPLATPLTYQLTPVQLSNLIGQNSIQADAGVVTVTYRTDARTEYKIYPYQYSYKYGDTAQNVFDISCDLPSYFKLTIFGEATNPSWRVVQNGSIVKSGKLNATIGSSQKLVINTDPKATEIGLYTLSNTRINNLYGYSDFATERIFALPQGESQVQVLTEDEQPPKVMIEVLKHV